METNSENTDLKMVENNQEQKKYLKVIHTWKKTRKLSVPLIFMLFFPWGQQLIKACTVAELWMENLLSYGLE